MSLKVETFVVGPLSNNLYLLIDDVAQEAVLIDPSIDSAPALARVRQLSNSGVRLTAIWNTHGHFDHVYDNALWKDAFPVPISMHRDDEFWLERLREQALWMGYPPPVAVPPDHWLTDGEIVAVGTHHARVLHTPGHSPGSVSFFFEADEVCISGDVLFQGSVGRTDLPHCSVPQLQHSLAKLVALPPTTRILPGHYDPTTIQQELEINPFCQQLPRPDDSNQENH